MWFFDSPRVVYGDGALAHLGSLVGERVCLVTDATLRRLGYAERVLEALAPTGMSVAIFSEVEPEPSLETAQRGADFLRGCTPDWIVALGGGSVIDAAKAMWVLYERPDLTPEAINPIDRLDLRRKARLAAIPTTSGTGSEATWAIVLTDPRERRKLGLGNPEDLPDLAILDPQLALGMPARLTADTGLDALTHAVEGFTATWHNDFSDGLCLNAARLIFEYLPRAYRDGADEDARAHLQNAAAIAGLGFGNAMAALAHGMGHALGAVFHIPHGRAVALCLPYSIAYCAGGPEPTRYAPLARFLGLEAPAEPQAAVALSQAIRDLARAVGQPLTLQDCDITRDALDQSMDLLVADALNDTQTIMSTRIPESAELCRLFAAVWSGGPINFYQ